MHRLSVLAVGLVLIYSVSSAQDITVSARIIDDQSQVPSVNLPSELDRVLRDYERHWLAKDGAALSALFTDDGFIQRGGPWIRGRDAIQSTYSQTSGGDLRLRAVGYAAADTVGYIVGAYRYGAATNDGGKFILALRRAPRGEWKIAADLDASNRQ
jgi:ketosteroid isomerase-like protein